MNDFTQNRTGNAGSDTFQDIKEKVASSAQQLQDKATGMTGLSSEQIKQQASQAMDSVKQMASETGEKLGEKIEEQKNVSADYAKSFAESLRRAAGEFDQQIPIAGQYIRSAAEQVDTFSNSVRNGNVGDLVKSAQDFARRQPTAFLGLTVLVGFGLVRFLKSAEARPASAPTGTSTTGDYKGAA